VSQVTLSSSGGRIIVASDGVWDAVRSGGKGAAHRIRNQACTKAASNLRTHSKEQGSRDDITVIVADLMPDTTARLPPALSDPVSAVSISTKGDCSSSVASLAHGVNKKVCWQAGLSDCASKLCVVSASRAQ
jgi:serine/threonine protein phosphatase PrpC